MKKTRHILWTLFWLPLIVAAAVYVAGDFLNADLACWAGAGEQAVFTVSTTMILLTLAVVPLALRLLRFRRIHEDLLARKAPALLRWGSVRLILLGLLLVANTWLYYAFAFESSFGYLAAITVLTFPFVMPTKNRCLAETEPDPEPEPEPVLEEDEPAAPDSAGETTEESTR